MAANLSGRFRIDVEALPKYGKLRIELLSDNLQSGATLVSEIRVAGLELTLKNFPIRPLSDKRLRQLPVFKREGKVTGDEFNLQDIIIEIPRVKLGYSLKAKLSLRGDISGQFDSYSGNLNFSFSLKGPRLLPSFSEDNVTGTFTAERVT